jgi:hypothetical protein
MKNSTKIALGLFTAAAAITTTIIMAVTGKHKDDCIETDCEELDTSDESTEEVED